MYLCIMIVTDIFYSFKIFIRDALLVGKLFLSLQPILDKNPKGYK